MQLDHLGLGNEFEIEILDLDHHASMHRFMLVSMVMLVGCKGGAHRHESSEGDDF
ncbi:hypothetical protein MASR2M50_34710 [Thauera sp.]|jgi:hypothetical protein